MSQFDDIALALEEFFAPTPAVQPVTPPTTPSTPITDVFHPAYTPAATDLTPPPAYDERTDSLSDLCDCFRTLTIGVIIATVCAFSFFQLAARSIIRNYNTSDHGNHLYDFITNVRDLDYEVHGEFDPFGFKLYEVSQQVDDSVQYETEATRRSYEACFGKNIVVHNHPVQDCPFSVGDLLSTAHLATFNHNTAARRELVISPHYVYELTAPNGWPDFLEASTFFSELISNYTVACENGFIEPYTRDDLDSTYVTTDLLLERYAQHFELVYTVTPIEQWDLFSALP